MRALSPSLFLCIRGGGGDVEVFWGLRDGGGGGGGEVNQLTARREGVTTRVRLDVASGRIRAGRGAKWY